MTNPRKSADATKLIILYRHGLAEPGSVEKPDEERALTDEGHMQTQRRGRGLATLVKRPDAILTSPLIRAVETAVWISSSWNKKLDVTLAECLRSGTPSSTVINGLRSIEGNRIVAVGHEPHLTAVMAAMTGVSAGGLKLSKDGCYGIELGTEGAELKFYLSPALLDRAGR